MSALGEISHVRLTGEEKHYFEIELVFNGGWKYIRQGECTFY